MADAILVLNAGSSSIKFSVFTIRAEDLALAMHGQIEGIYTAPRFAAQDASGAQIDAQKWDEGTRLGHDGAIDYLIQFLRDHREGHRLVAVGHRVVHGGLEFSEPTLVNAQVIAKLEKEIEFILGYVPHLHN